MNKCISCGTDLLDNHGRLIGPNKISIDDDGVWYIACPSCEAKNGLRQRMQLGPTVWDISHLVKS